MSGNGLDFRGVGLGNWGTSGTGTSTTSSSNNAQSLTPEFIKSTNTAPPTTQPSWSAPVYGGQQNAGTAGQPGTLPAGFDKSKVEKGALFAEVKAGILKGRGG